MNRPDSQSPENQEHSDTPSEGGKDVPSFLSRVMHVASGLVKHVRESPSLRNEVVQILRHLEQAITPSEPPESDPTPVKSTQDIAKPEGVTEQVPMPVLEQEPVRPPAPEAPPVMVDASTLQELVKEIASVNAFGGKDGTSPVARPKVGLEAIARSCRVKAEACAWAVRRKMLIADGVDFRTEVAPRDRALIEKARTIEDCYLWMAASTAPMPEPMELYSGLADTFENAADAADLLAELIQQNDEREMLEAAMLLGAEAQSVLREAVSTIGFRGDDPTESALYHWLRQTAHERDLFIPRYIRMAEKPDSTEAASLSGRIADLQTRHRTHTATKKLIDSALKKMRYHLGLISPQRENSHDWNKVFATITEIVPKYLRANDVQLRELLIKSVDDIPEGIEPPEAGQDVLEAIDRFLATRPEADSDEKIQIVLSPEVTALKKNLRGKTIVVIGGEARPYAREALRETFDLREVVWISTREHGSPDVFKPAIRGSGVALVLLAIRWSSHSFGVVGEYCEEVGVPFVRLPAGYNPLQVARQIIDQVPAIAKAEPQASGQK